MLIARFDETYQREQTLKQHCLNVAEKNSENLAPFGLSQMGFLMGWLHDLCKSMDTWQAAILAESEHYKQNRERANRQPLGVPHAPPAAQFIYHMLMTHANTKVEKAALQVLCTVIRAHHGYLMDGLSLDGVENYKEKICDLPTDQLPDVHAYFDEVISEEELLSIWEDAKSEMDSLFKKIIATCAHIPQRESETSMHFMLGLAVRTAYSALIDADRLDAANFEKGVLEAVPPKAIPNWQIPQNKLEERLGQFSSQGTINEMRALISSSCLEAAGWEENLQALHAPTGGGKTLASLRWALERARRKGRNRIFYIVSYTTILDQVYGDYIDLFKDIRDLDILLHHSNVIPDESNNDQNPLSHQEERQLLIAERWDADIILTTQVQFFNAFFLGSGKAARRLRALHNAVIIFDEVQTIPVHLIYLFNLAVAWLTNICDCDLLLSTATQPTLTQMKYPLPPVRNIFTYPEDLFLKMKRVTIIDDRSVGPMDAPALADYLFDKQKKWLSVLVVLNTRTAARRVYDALSQMDIPDVALYLLSNDMCVKHRKEIINELKFAQNQECICISTQLIECGVDLSFGCGVRSLAGADNIWQTAGRCNRHGSNRDSLSPVYIIKCAEENLNHLKDIERAQIACELTLHYHPQADDLQQPATMNQYYERYYREQIAYLPYLLERNGKDIRSSTNMIDLLSMNNPGRNILKENQSRHPGFPLVQAFHTAGKHFSVINSLSISLIVPYQRGAEIILELNAHPTLQEESKLIREAQLYTINIFKYTLEKLGKSAIFVLPNGAYALRPEWYDGKKRGLLYEPEYKPENYIY